MIKPNKLNKGDKVAIVSLSNGILGMPFASHEVEIGLKRLEDYGLVPVIMPNSMKDMGYLRDHPEERASDLKQAFMDDEIKGIKPLPQNFTTAINIARASDFVKAILPERVINTYALRD